MKVAEWPNKLGWDVGACAEVVRGKPNQIFVRLFRRGQRDCYHVEESSLLFGDGISVDEQELVERVKEVRANA